MLPHLYLGAGTALLLGFAVAAFSGWEFVSPERGVPTPGQALVATGWFHSSGSGGRSYWYSSSTRSGGSVFGGK